MWNKILDNFEKEAIEKRNRDEALQINDTKKYVYEEMSEKCRLFGIWNETMVHIVVECPKLDLGGIYSTE